MLFSKQRRRRQRGRGRSFLLVSLFLNHLNCEHCGESWCGLISFGGRAMAHVIVWSPVEGMLRSRAPNTHWRRKLFMPDCDAPFCHYSIIEGHSFTITVGLWVSADIINSRSVTSCWESRQEFLAYPSIFRHFSAFFPAFYCYFFFIINCLPFLRAKNVFFVFVNTLSYIARNVSCSFRS